eukprot:GHVU01173030.1.p1 GENE.GHVU01173030.1~~GHVU01173030.1.p1  ORF type:complete len:137 (+),score=8.18 GHVU01173030.1:216-626(+)
MFPQVFDEHNFSGPDCRPGGHPGFPSKVKQGARRNAMVDPTLRAGTNSEATPKSNSTRRCTVGEFGVTLSDSPRLQELIKSCPEFSQALAAARKENSSSLLAAKPNQSDRWHSCGRLKVDGAPANDPMARARADIE